MSNEPRGHMKTFYRKIGKLLALPVKPLVEEEFDRQIQSRADLIPISNTTSEDIFIAGYPKSGNTWFQNLITGVVFGMDGRFVPDALVQSLVPDVHAVRYYRRYLTPMYFKTHALPQPEYRKVVYLVRDGRDVMVSYLHHLAALEKSAPDFLHLVETGEGLFPCRWHEHVEAWRANPHGASVLTIAYEALKKDPLSELKRFCEFAGIERDERLLEAAIRTNSFEVMRQKEETFGSSNVAWPRDKPFVRRGVVGSFKDEMPPEVLDSFMRQSASAMASLGYSV